MQSFLLEVRQEGERRGIRHASRHEQSTLDRGPRDLAQQHLEPLSKSSTLRRRVGGRPDQLDAPLELDEERQRQGRPRELELRRQRLRRRASTYRVDARAHDEHSLRLERRGERVRRSGGGGEDKRDALLQDDEQGVERVERVEKFGEVPFIERLTTGER